MENKRKEYQQLQMGSLDPSWQPQALDRREPLSPNLRSLFAKIPLGRFIIIPGNDLSWDKVFPEFLTEPRDYQNPYVKEEISVQLFLNEKGQPRRVQVLILGSNNIPAREKTYFLAKVLKKREGENEKTDFRLSLRPGVIGLIKAGEIVAISSKLLNEFGFWQDENKRITKFEPKTGPSQKFRPKKLPRF